jgi:hypothetical protein
MGVTLDSQMHTPPQHPTAALPDLPTVGGNMAPTYHALVIHAGTFEKMHEIKSYEMCRVRSSSHNPKQQHRKEARGD